MSRVRLGGALVVALTRRSGGCGGDDVDPAAASGTLVIALPSQPENLNPIDGDNVYEGNQKFFNGLLRYDKDLDAEPDLASAMPERSADGKTVTVKLRDDVKFHDGTPLTAKDVAFTYNAILDPDSASPLATLLDSLDGDGGRRHHRASSSSTARTRRSTTSCRSGSSRRAGSRARTSRTPRSTASRSAPVRTSSRSSSPAGGSSWSPTRRYFRGEPKIKRIVLTAVEDENARVALLEKGTVDAAGIVPKLAQRVRKNGNYNVFEVRTADARVAALPNRDPVLRDPAVRRALSYARRPPEDRRQRARRRRRAGVRPDHEGPLGVLATSPSGRSTPPRPGACSTLRAGRAAAMRRARRAAGSCRSRSCTRPTTACARTSRSRSRRR